MSLRKAKLLLQKKKQMEAQKQIHQSDQEQQVVKPTKTNVFAAFGGDDSEDEKQQELRQKQQDQQVQQKQEKKKKKKKKKNKKQNQDDDELKEVHQTLKQLGFDPVQQKQHTAANQAWMDILEINQSKFNYQKQLRRHFRGWQPEKEEGDPEQTKKQQKMHKHLKKLMKKSVLSPGVGEYFPIREKFQVERQDERLTFQATKKYHSLQKQYQVIRNSNDINALFQFTQFNPQHVDSLYDVGEFLRLQGNYRDADNLIQRVIYIYEMAGGYELGEFINQPFTRKYLVYDETSKSFFMSLFKFMDILGKKGCFRTALQFNKFLLKINLNDPTACLLCIDFNAVSSKQFDFLCKFVQHYGAYSGAKDTSLYLVPSFTYSVALSKFLLQSQPIKQTQLLVEQIQIKKLLQFSIDHWNKALSLPTKDSFVDEDPRVLILRAIMVYPKLIIDIAVKNDYSKQFLNHELFKGWQKKSYQQILGHQFWTMVPTSYAYNFLRLQSIEDSKGLDKVLDVYVQRSKILWKSNNVILWIKGALGFVLDRIEEKFDYQSYLQALCLEETTAPSIPFNLSRYANINRNNFSDRVQRIDLNNIQDNQQAVVNQPQGQPLNMNQNPFQLFLNSLLPWVNLPNAQPPPGEYDPDMPFIEEDQA